MTAFQASLLASALPTVLVATVGIWVTYLVGKKTDDALKRFIQEIATPMQDTVTRIAATVEPLPENIKFLRGLFDDLVRPLQEVASNLGQILRELRGNR